MATVRIPSSVTDSVREAFAVLREPPLVLWSLFVLLIPFYIFDNGLPQPGDLLVLPLLPVALHGWRGRLPATSARPVRALAAFTAWAILVNWTWAIALGNFTLLGRDAFLIFPIYYLYNALVFLVACVLYQRYGARFLWVTLHVILVSAVLQVVMSFVFQRLHGFRGTGFFNNPNQLGFFALLCGSIIALGRRRLGFGIAKASIGLTACLYLALLSASKAAVLGIVILGIFTVISNPRVLVVAALMVIGLVSIGGPVANAIEGTQKRLAENRYPQFSFFEQRGYDRIYEHQEYWLLGAGEGGTSRFAETTVIGSHEIHSSVGTIFFSYGIVGMALFLAFLWRVAQGAPLRSKLMLLPPLSYTVAHQGLRDSLLWILFAVFVLIKHQDRETQQQPAR